ncbi:hypothetical protein OE88DRAFT_1662338 [Heliocybe sulcata]|uniref:Uncharacterized protein n=1 Tax=Heliocybe sulcata TaxID=5364 RepID=A0A5C3MXS0_9AGAM|nr:hypothetical protein OE88DRAFT_1662338 [Heliocybe sulcata]
MTVHSSLALATVTLGRQVSPAQGHYHPMHRPLDLDAFNRGVIRAPAITPLIRRSRCRLRQISTCPRHTSLGGTGDPLEQVQHLWPSKVFKRYARLPSVQDGRRQHCDHPTKAMVAENHHLVYDD